MMKSVMTVLSHILHLGKVIPGGHCGGLRLSKMSSVTAGTTIPVYSRYLVFSSTELSFRSQSTR